MRTAALSAMELLGDFSPRLVGPVLLGTADDNSAINLHLFADSAEMVAMEIGDMGIQFRPYERRLKSRRGQIEMYPGFEFSHCNETVQATVFPVDGIRQAPISPVDGKPMKRAGSDRCKHYWNTDNEKRGQCYCVSPLLLVTASTCQRSAIST